MKRTLVAPLHVKSENQIRSLVNRWAVAGAISKARKDTACLLSQLSRPSRELEDGVDNRFVVTLTRISAGYLDKHDWHAAFKAHVDEIAAWIGIDDNDQRVEWKYSQEGCRKKLFGVRIVIEDLAAGDDEARELANIPSETWAAKQRGAEKPAKPVKAPKRQVELVFRESFAVLPWEQDNSDEPLLAPLALKGTDPPKRITMRVPAVMLASGASVQLRPGSTMVFERALGRLGDREIWIFSPAGEETRTQERAGSGRR